MAQDWKTAKQEIRTFGNAVRNLLGNDPNRQEPYCLIITKKEILDILAQTDSKIDALRIYLGADTNNHFVPTAHVVACENIGSEANPQYNDIKIGAEELGKICDLIIHENNSRAFGDKKVYLMFDQMYWTLTYGTTRHFNPVTLRPEMREYCIFIDGISKAFAATGVRVGWAVGPANVIAKMKALLSHLGAWAPMAEQKAVAAYLPQKEAVNTYLTSFKAALEERLIKIYNGFISLKKKGYPVDAIAPQAAIYLTIKIDIVGKNIGDEILETQADATSYILSEAKLAVVPFYAFGADSQSPWYRLSVGTCRLDEITPMFEQLEKALEMLS